jgi:hypothetical protein
VDPVRPVSRRLSRVTGPVPGVERPALLSPAERDAEREERERRRRERTRRSAPPQDGDGRLDVRG